MQVTKTLMRRPLPDSWYTIPRFQGHQVPMVPGRSPFLQKSFLLTLLTPKFNSLCYKQLLLAT